MRKRREEESHSNQERWLLTYSDMITLLMAFFIMMYSMSVLNLAKFREVAVSIRSGFGGLVKGQGKAAFGSSGVFASKPSPVEGDTAGVSWRVLKPLVEYVETGKTTKNQASVREDRRGVVITLSSEGLLFDAGSTRIRPGAKSVLGRVANVLKASENLVQIEGHTCDLAPRGSRYPSNWELSTARATEVLRYLTEEQHLPADRFAAAGYGSVRPVVRNTCAANRSKNRRVEIVLLRPEVAQAVMDGGTGRKIADPNTAVIRRRLD